MYPNLCKKYFDVVTGGIYPYGKIPDIITVYVLVIRRDMEIPKYT
jgi:hypothetical protein